MVPITRSTTGALHAPAGVLQSDVSFVRAGANVLASAVKRSRVRGAARLGGKARRAA